MKKKALKTITAIALVFGTSALVGCGGSHNPAEHEGHDHETHAESQDEKAEQTDGDAGQNQVKYQCPMDCENGKTYGEPGTCPVCKMGLVEMKVAKVANPENEDNEHGFACPMHPEITGHEGDKCSKCGMDLTEIEPE